MAAERGLRHRHVTVGTLPLLLLASTQTPPATGACMLVVETTTRGPVQLCAQVEAAGAQRGRDHPLLFYLWPFLLWPPPAPSPLGVLSPLPLLPRRRPRHLIPSTHARCFDRLGGGLSSNLYY
jgi:hypothetical protein